MTETNNIEEDVKAVESEEIKSAAPEKETKWYVLRVVSGKERKVKEYLDKDIIRNGWDKLILQVFLPVEKVYKVQNGKKVMRERNFYPGYVMIEVIDGKLTDEIVPSLRRTRVGAAFGLAAAFIGASCVRPPRKKNRDQTHRPARRK